MMPIDANVVPVTSEDAEKLEAAYRRAADGQLPDVLDPLHIAAWRRQQIRGLHLRNLKKAAPSLLLLAGCGVWAFAPQLMNSVGIALFTVATLLNLVGCLRQ